MFSHHRKTALTGAITLALFVQGAHAQDAKPANASTLDQIVVTGTHAKDRTVLDSPVPIDVLTPEDLRSAGAVNGELGSALATLLPSFNFPRQSNSGGSDHVRAAQLRGMSPDQVLVLVNGKRFHTSALVNSDTKIGRGTTPVDFNAIPISAIKRIEVLRDGAGAQYGSDAIAGVVNIILDDAPEGGEVTSSYGAYHTNFRPTGRTITDGQSSYASAKFGTKLGASGFFRAGLESNQHDATNRAGPDQIPSWENQSPANLALQGKRNYAAGDPKNENYSGWLNAELPLGDTVTAYAFGIYTQRHTIGDNYFRYPDSDANVPAIYPSGYRPESIGTNRDINLTTGARGHFGEWDIDSSLTWGGNSFAYNLRDSVNVSLGDESPTQFRIGKYSGTQGTANIDLSRPFEWGSTLYTLATGAEYRRETFRTYAGDPASYAVGPIVGAPTGAQAGGGLTPQDTANLSRHVGAAYVDLSADLTEKFFADAAARYEHYNDFGGAWTGKLSGRYAFTPDYALRGAISNNIRAPSLSQVGFESTSTGYGANGELVQGRVLSVNNPIARGLGATDLQPEKSRNISLGFTARVGEHFDASLDIFRIDVDHRVTLSETIATDGLESYILAHFGVPGVQSVAFFTNAVDTRTRGAELVANYRNALYGGNFTLTGTYSYNRTSIRNVRDTPTQLAALGADAVLFGLEERNTLTDASPRQRGALTARWDSTHWGLLTRLTRQGSTTRVFDFGDGFVPTQTYAARWQLDAEVEWRATERLSLALGGQNITDQYPTRSIPDIAYAGNFPYDVISPIGVNGAYWYGRVRYSF
ncbi:iron complex outermembrane receptor protein [Luteibacter sp. Sphag1AF]|uniref:TonB-dependent receptor plug domain-containing protein n=1 Tax=Luteibacter sp. Sphag1AF TaxID=2587031 RepID=UPI00161C9C8C|nr:TonB-dependent receptor [Luteibacter sp. Sphag1AF]MBB3227381.1 iron complex outermembrane receptor protein [Luteibacter sp. Sphag1AF]